MSPQNKKITRSHHHQKSRSNVEAKGERFFLQGVRWRFPRDTGIAEVQARISRLRELWNDQEAFCRQAVWIDQEHAAFVTPQLLDEAVRWLQRPRPLELTAFHFGPRDLEPSDYDQRSLALQVLSLTKLNWASTDAFCGEPITVKYASDIAYLTAAFLRQKEPFTLHETLESTPWFI